MAENSGNSSKTAEAYEKNTRISMPSYDALFAMIQSYFRVELGGIAASLLVVGAGGGQELAAWGPSNPSWAFTGVDPSREMLEIARQKADRFELANRVRLIQGTVDAVPEEDPKFDAGSCILVLHFIHEVAEKRKLLRSVRAKLKPGAPFVLVSAYGNQDEAELKARLHVWRSFWIDGGRDAAEMDELVSNGIKKLSLLPEEEIAGLLAEAGFTKITRFYSTALMAGWMAHAE